MVVKRKRRALKLIVKKRTPFIIRTTKKKPLVKKKKIPSISIPNINDFTKSPAKKQTYPMNRGNWITQMYDFGQYGIEDFNHLHKKVIPASKKLVVKTKHKGMSLKVLESGLDVKGYDMPRGDVDSIKVQGRKTIRVGSENIKHNNDYFRQHMVPVINRAFTKDELGKTEVYIEYPSKKLRGKKYDGMSASGTSTRNIKYSLIDVARKKDTPTLIHEIVHAVRFAHNKDLRNYSKDEAETELETMARLSKHERSKIPPSDGYYQFLKGDKRKLRNEDERIIDENCNLHNKKGLSQCIRKHFKKTNIGKLKVPKRDIPKHRGVIISGTR